VIGQLHAPTVLLRGIVNSIPKLGELQRRSGRFGGTQKSADPLRFRTADRQARSLVAVPV
jgi:hypothetical protein